MAEPRETQMTASSSSATLAWPKNTGNPLLSASPATNHANHATREITTTVTPQETWISYLNYKLNYSKRVRLLCVAVVLAAGFGLDFLDYRTTTFLVTGGGIGCVSSMIVMFLTMRRYNDFQLLFWRSFSDFGVALRFLLTFPLNKYTCHNDSTGDSCAFPSAWLEFFELASELWFAIIAIDILVSLLNPFSTTKDRMVKFHIIVWSVSLIFASVTGANSSIYGYWFVANDKSAICWIRADQHKVSIFAYLMFYIPLLVMYTFAVISLVVAYRRLRNGISNTIIYRMRALVINSLNVVVYALYWFVLGIILLAAYAVQGQGGSVLSERILVYLIAAKGISSVVIWILTEDVSFTLKNKRRDRETIADSQDLSSVLRSELLFFATAGIRNCAKRANDLPLTATSQALRLHHQAHKKINLSLSFFFFLIAGREQERKHIATLASETRKKSTMGILEGIRISDTVTSNPLLEEIEAEFGLSGGIILPERHSDQRNSIDNGGADMLTVEVVNDEEITNHGYLASLGAYLVRLFGDVRPYVDFTEIAPIEFRRVRRSQHISDEEYIGQFRTTIKERITQGGASGAFFFFSRDEKFIAKSCTMEELQTISSNAKSYADYLENKKGSRSFISKIYGVYTLQIYSISLHFFVMNNLFVTKDELGENLAVHEKYDIKGSTVMRSADPPREGQTVNCKNCEQKFVYQKQKRGRKIIKTHGSSLTDTFSVVGSMTYSDIEEEMNKCSYTVGGRHEPNVILKDNDLKYKIRLPREVAKEVSQQLENDANFLLSIGVMDYSLLVGVHNREYDVEDFDKKSRSALYTVAGRLTSSTDSGENSSDPGTSAEHIASTPENSDSQEIEPRKLEVQLLLLAAGVSRVVGPASYQMGIIDFQQKWNWNKKLERFIKIHFKGNDPQGLSAIEPEQYRERFVNHIKDILDVDYLDRSNSHSTSTV